VPSFRKVVCLPTYVSPSSKSNVPLTVFLRAGTVVMEVKFLLSLIKIDVFLFTPPDLCMLTFCNFREWVGGISHPMLVLQENIFNACIAGEYLKCSSSVRSKRCWISWKCPCSSYAYKLALSPVLTVGSILCGNLKFLHICRHAMSNVLQNNLGCISK
jgi:hypothetical protein